MLPETVTSLKNVSPLAVVTPFRRAAGRCACRPDASFFSVRHAVVKVPPAPPLSPVLGKAMASLRRHLPAIMRRSVT